MWFFLIAGLVFLLIQVHIGITLIVIGMIIMACRGSKKEKGIPLSGIEKKCPRCAELVKAEAKICRFCQFEFSVEKPEEPPNL
jgi:hypothetical protein